MWNTVPDRVRNMLLTIVDPKNGEFWMPWQEFWKYFTSIDICQYTPDYNSDGIPDSLGKMSMALGVLLILGKFSTYSEPLLFQSMSSVSTVNGKAI